MSDWDENSPGDSDIVSQYPSNERGARAAAKGNFGVDHHEADDADVGKHEVIQLLDQSGDATIDVGDLGIWNDGGALKTRNGTGGVEQIARTSDVSGLVFPSGTKMVFYQAAAPAGWTQDTGVNDQVLKVVSGTGGGTGGSWTISGVTIDNHTLTVSQMPSHNHGGASGSTAPGTNTTGSHGHTGSANSAGAHTHSYRFDNDGPDANSENDGFSSDSTNGAFTNELGLNNVSGAINSAGAHTHSLSINSNGVHSHTVDSHTHSISSQGGGAGHNHGLTADGTWRPSHIDVIVAAKD